VRNNADVSDRVKAPEDQAVPVSFGGRITQLAQERPDDTALVFAPEQGPERPVTWLELDRASNQAAHRMAQAGVGQSSLVVLGFPNSVEHVVAALATWKVGACVLPLRWDLPDWERTRVLDVAQPSHVVADWDLDRALPQLRRADLTDPAMPSDPLPDVVPVPARSIASSGSTGTPKIILSNIPGQGVPGASLHNPTAQYMGHRPGQVVLIPAPLYHTNGFLMIHSALFEGQTAVLMQRFDPSRAVDLIERYRVNTFVAVTIMLQRMARLPDIHERDLSSIESMLHGGAPLPEWVARAWMDLIGPKRFFVCYGSSEQAGTTMTRGDVWLEHPGTVGLPFNSELKILDAEGTALPTGEVGEIWMRWVGQTERSFDYRGATPQTRDDFFSSVGDLGSVDEDGFLYLADRRKDLIISGGVNVYAAEVEVALTGHPAVDDVVVVGVADDEWGQRVHAIVQTAAQARQPSPDELREHCRARMAPYKVPRTFEFVEKLARSDAGKIRRSDYVSGATATDRA
jgi:bile acid-coenzyme A ligase